jgi:WS/DGAT/MGAT family acyltransferase
MGTAPIERISADDAQQLAADVGPVPMNVGALLLLERAAEPAALHDVLAPRLAAIPRLRQRLQHAPLGCGRDIWVDDEVFDIHRHLHRIPYSGEDPLDTVSRIVTQPLDRSHPLWRAALLEGLPDGDVGLVFAFHHVVADGIGGLAVLAGLVDGTGPPAPPPTPRPAPRARELFLEAAGSRLLAIRHVPKLARTLTAAIGELGGERTRAPACTLNTPSGPRRTVRAFTTDLELLRRAAHVRGVTLNDLLLTAASGALDDLLRSRGESLRQIVVSVPVSARPGAATDSLGNRTGVMPVPVPLDGSGDTRLQAVAQRTSARKTARRGASAALLTPVFRLLAALRLFRPLINRQRLVNTFLTNVRGPSQVVSIGGARVLRIVPVTITAGNVTVAFAVLSYGGTLTVGVICDPDAVPDAQGLAEAVRHHLDELRG